MRGPALDKQLNSLFPKIRIVYMTGYLDQNSEADSLQNAFFLQKPFSRESLLDKVSEVLQKSPQAKCVEQTTPV
jgi:FixJ family two-component response regulator